MNFSVTILGSSSALPSPQRFSTAHVLRADERIFLIDCGEGVQLQLRKFGIGFSRLNHIFISHLHGDHVYGLPGLVSSLSIMGRTETLHIYGPRELELFMKAQGQYFTVPGFPVEYHQLTPGVTSEIYQDKTLTVNAFPLEHRIPTWGFLFRERPRLRHIRRDMIDFFDIPVKMILPIKEGADYLTEQGELIENDRLTTLPQPARSYAFCSDTRYQPTLAETVRGVDLLYHESTFASAELARAQETFHSTATQSAQIALSAGVKQLLIGHYSARYRTIAPLLEEARAVFPNTIAAEDGLTIDL